MTKAFSEEGVVLDSSSMGSGWFGKGDGDALLSYDYKLWRVCWESAHPFLLEHWLVPRTVRSRYRHEATRYSGARSSILEATYLHLHKTWDVPGCATCWLTYLPIVGNIRSHWGNSSRYWPIHRRYTSP